VIEIPHTITCLNGALEPTKTPMQSEKNAYHQKTPATTDFDYKNSMKCSLTPMQLLSKKENVQRKKSCEKEEHYKKIIK